ncbi:MAG: hypothetical protein ACR2H2_00780 [Solirubrobacteraceae bacterium]
MPPDRSSTRQNTPQGTTRARPQASTVRGSAGALVAQVAQLARERDEFARQVAILDAKLIELTDQMLKDEAIRAAYRRGYFAGRASQRRGAPAVDDPERHARGWIRKALTT